MVEGLNFSLACGMHASKKYFNGNENKAEKRIGTIGRVCCLISGNKISIIVPCYNIEHLVKNTVESICNQTYSNLEIILVDDGSSDSTAEVLKELALSDSRIKVIRKNNGGVTNARLAGVSVATGDWIGFVDGDDWIEPNMYETLLSNALKYKSDISHCGYQMIFPSRVDYYYNTGRLVEQDKLTGLKDLLDGSFIEPGLWNKLFHKTLFHSLLHDSVMDCSIKNLEDLLMNFYLFKYAEKSIYQDICPYHYIVRNGSASKSGVNKHQLGDPIKVFEIILKETDEAHELQDIVKKRLLAKYIVNATSPLGNNADLISEFRDQARRYLRRNFKNILKGNYSKREKLMAAWVVIWPASYAFAHELYSVIKGTKYKYEVK